jgi:hypothetical protein
VSIPLAAAEGITDASGIALRIEVLLPTGVRHRQLRVRTLILGMLLTLDSRRPAFLTEVHAALTALPEAVQARLGVIEDWEHGPHQLTYRQVERTFSLVVTALGKDQPDGSPSGVLASVLDDLLEASIPAEHKDTSTALAVDWTDVETFARPPRHGSTGCAGPEASWGHRTSNLPGPRGEMFFGFYLSAATMTREENGPPVPELARRMTLTSCRPGPARALAPVLTRMPAAGILYAIRGARPQPPRQRGTARTAGPLIGLDFPFPIDAVLAEASAYPGARGPASASPRPSRGPGSPRPRGPTR